MRFVVVIGLFSGTFVAAMATKRILFGVVSDQDIHRNKIVNTIETVIKYFRETTNGDVHFIIHVFNELQSLHRQIDTCSIPGEIRVLVSATTCNQMLRLSRQSAKLEMLHFAVNINDCSLLPVSVHRSFVDSAPSSGVVKAIFDVLLSRRQDSDILIFHDTQYERIKTVNALLQELAASGFSHSYFQVNGRTVPELTQKAKVLKEDTMQLDAIVLADFAVFKRILDEMYSQKTLDPTVSYLIVNDGWEFENPEIETPQTVHYDVDVLMFLLKRKLQPEFTFLLSDMARRTMKNAALFHYSEIPYLTREEVFLVAAVCSVVEAIENFPNQESDTSHFCQPDDSSNFSSPHQKISKSVRESLQNMGVIATSLSYELLRNIPLSSKTEIFKLVALWKSGSPNRLSYLQSETKLLFENQTLKIAMPFIPPYTLQIEGEEQTGTMNMLFKYLTQNLHFRYEVICPEDNEWGVRLSENEWSGAVGMLLTRNVDLVPFLGITMGRSRVLDFSQPVMTTASGILVRKPKESSRAFIFLRPFKLEVWVCIIAVVLATSVMLYLINYHSPYYSQTTSRKRGLFRLRNCLWYVYGATLQQGGVYLPDAISARILVSFWWLFVLVTVATYSGHLISFLTFPEASWLVSSIEELSKDSSLIVYVMEGNSVHQEIYESPMEALNLLRTRFETNNGAIVFTNLTTVMTNIKEGQAALIDDVYVLYNIIDDMYRKNGMCELAVVPEQFSEMYLAIATRRGSPYIKDIDKLIRHLWLSGLMQNWAKVYSMQSQECNFLPNKLRGGRRDVMISDMQGAFYILAFGIAIAFVVMCIEISWRKCHRIQKSKVYIIQN